MVDLEGAFTAQCVKDVMTVFLQVLQFGAYEVGKKVVAAHGHVFEITAFGVFVQIGRKKAQFVGLVMFFGCRVVKLRVFRLCIGLIKYALFRVGSEGFIDDVFIDKRFDLIGFYYPVAKDARQVEAHLDIHVGQVPAYLCRKGFAETDI